MKTFKILRQIFQILAVAMFVLSIVMCGIDNTTENTAFLTTLTLYGSVVIFAVVGAFLTSAPSDIARRIGHGLLIPSFAVGLTVALLYLDGTAAIVMLVAAILLALYYLWALVIRILQKNGSQVDSPYEDIRIVRVKEWKQIMEEGIISPEEYEEKRCQLLGLKSKNDDDDQQ